MNPNKLVSDIEDIKEMLSVLSQRPTPATAEQLQQAMKLSENRPVKVQLDESKLANNIKTYLPNYDSVEKRLNEKIGEFRQVESVQIKESVFYWSIVLLVLMVFFFGGCNVFYYEKNSVLSDINRAQSDTLAVFRKATFHSMDLIGTKVKSRSGFIKTFDDYYNKKWQDLEESKKK